MNLLPLLPARSWLMAVAAVVASLIGGAFRSQSLLAMGFAGLVVGKAATSVAARLLLNHFTQQTIAELSRNLSRRVLATPLSQLERVGISRILVTLTEDVAMIGWAAQNVPTFAMNVAVLAGCAIYLGWLSWQMLLRVTFFIVIGSLVYRILIGRAYRYLQHARDTRAVLFQHFRGLTEGIKELKLHAVRREAFLSERIATATEALRRDALAGVRHHALADTWSQLLFYGLIGGTLLATAAMPSLSTKTRTGYVLAMLYVMNPVWSLMEGWPIFARARIALAKVNGLGLSLKGLDAEPVEAVDAGPLRAWSRLRANADGATCASPGSAARGLHRVCAAGDHGRTDVNLLPLLPARSWLMAVAAVVASLIGGAFKSHTAPTSPPCSPIFIYSIACSVSAIRISTRALLATWSSSSSTQKCKFRTARFRPLRCPRDSGNASPC
ncbi:MAG: hypothetical protein DMG06_14800 [Acidobacteria bacterium]|nr:MAG: hypothetical protein DMG06_14800 [Acidobacteriota bacterium]